MRSLLLLTPALLALQLAAQQGPDPARVKAMHDQIKAKVLDPANLAALGQTHSGCRPDEEGSATNDFSTASRAVGTTVNPRLQSPVVDANPVAPAERAPHYFPPESRLPAKAFAFVEQNGKVRSIADLGGKVAVVFLFKPDCKFTADVIGEIIRLQGLQKGKPFEILPVSIGREGWVGLASWRRQNMNLFPADFTFYRANPEAGTGTSVFGELFATPTTLILDRQGRVAWRFNGAMRGALADRLNQIVLEGVLETLPVAQQK